MNNEVIAHSIAIIEEQLLVIRSAVNLENSVDERLNLTFLEFLKKFHRHPLLKGIHLWGTAEKQYTELGIGDNKSYKCLGDVPMKVLLAEPDSKLHRYPYIGTKSVTALRKFFAAV